MWKIGYYVYFLIKTNLSKNSSTFFWLTIQCNLLFDWPSYFLNSNIQYIRSDRRRVSSSRAISRRGASSTAISFLTTAAERGGIPPRLDRDTRLWPSTSDRPDAFASFHFSRPLQPRRRKKAAYRNRVLRFRFYMLHRIYLFSIESQTVHIENN